MSKRYNAVYVNPNFLDGFWDNKEKRYLDVDEIKNIIYENLKDKEIENILNMNENEEIKDKKNMSNVKLLLEGIGIVLLGLVYFLWSIVKFISCIIIAGVISVKLGLDSYYWWCSSIIIFSLLIKLTFLNNSINTYKDLVENYSDKTKNSS